MGAPNGTAIHGTMKTIRGDIIKYVIEKWVIHPVSVTVDQVLTVAIVLVDNVAPLTFPTPIL